MELDEQEINTNGIAACGGWQGCATKGGKGIPPSREAAESRLQRILPATLAKTAENAVVPVAAGNTQWRRSPLPSATSPLGHYPHFCPFRRDRCPRLACGRAYSTLNGESIIKVTVQWLRDRVPGQDVGEGESSYVHPRMRCEYICIYMAVPVPWRGIPDQRNSFGQDPMVKRSPCVLLGVLLLCNAHNFEYWYLTAYRGRMEEGGGEIAKLNEAYIVFFIIVDKH